MSYFRQIRDTQGIFAYDADSNEWTLIFEYPPNLKIDEHITYWNQQEYELVLCGKRYDALEDSDELSCALTMIIIDFTTRQHDVVVMDRYRFDTEILESSSIAYINDEYHIIGGSAHSHSRWTPNFADIITVRDVNELYGVSLHGFVELKSARKCLLFGGYDYRSEETRDSFWEYDIEHNRWKKLSMTLPKPLKQFGVVLTADERYIIVIGGTDQEDQCCDTIYIVDLKKMSIRESEVKSPQYSILNACLYVDTREKLATEGFVRECAEEMELYIPRDLRKMVGRWFAVQDIHLLVYHSDRDEDVHYRMDVASVLGL